MSTMTANLPMPAPRLQKSTTKQMVYQGVYLHYASFWGPLRTSKTARAANPKWFSHALYRWFTEYGLNFIVLGLTIITILRLLPQNTWVWAIPLAFLLPPFLTVAQMFLDQARTDSNVYYDPESKTGLTVKTTVTGNGETLWSYYNHFALPVGARKGKPIREQLHAQAAQTCTVLACTAQNMEVAAYYMREFNNGTLYPSKRPYMIWNYTKKPWVPPTPSNWFRNLFGVDSTRNSGQIPLTMKIA